MVDERAFKDVYGAVNPQRCVFEKAVLRRSFGCSKATRTNIAEREAIGCAQDQAQQRCAALIEQLRNSATFALGLTHVEGPLPHAKEVKIQCGGLIGLREVLEETPSAGMEVDDIYSLIDSAMLTFESLANLPYSSIVQSIGHYDWKRRTPSY